MNGQQYLGYKRDGKNVTVPSEKRPPRKIKETCSSKNAKVLKTVSVMILMKPGD